MSTTILMIAAQVFQILVAGHWLFPPECPDQQSWQYVPEHHIYACRVISNER